MQLREPQCPCHWGSNVKVISTTTAHVNHVADRDILWAKLRLRIVLGQADFCERAFVGPPATGSDDLSPNQVARGRPPIYTPVRAELRAPVLPSFLLEADGRRLPELRLRDAAPVRYRLVAARIRGCSPPLWVPPCIGF